MTRGPDGTTTQPRSDTALFAHIASKLEAVTTKGLESYIRGLGLAVGEDAVRKAPATAARTATLPSRAVRPWLLVNLDALNLFMALVRLKAQPEGQVFQQVGVVTGVLHVMRLTDQGDVAAFVVYEDRSDQRSLRARLGEIGEIVSWEQIELESHDPAVLTWRSLAVRAAERENLLLADSA